MRNLLLVQRPLTWFLRSVIVLPAFVGIMLPRAETDVAFFKAYDYCVKVIMLPACSLQLQPVA